MTKSQEQDYRQLARSFLNAHGETNTRLFIDELRHLLESMPLVRHTERFQRVAGRYPTQVAAAYDGYLDRAMADSDERVAATVAEYERRQGLIPLDWSAIGVEERLGLDQG